MAEKLMLYYKYVQAEKGFEGKMQLAKMTKVPSTIAAIEKDTPENVAAFKKAVQEITGKPAPDY